MHTLRLPSLIAFALVLVACAPVREPAPVHTTAARSASAAPSIVWRTRTAAKPRPLGTVPANDVEERFEARERAEIRAARAAVAPPAAGARAAVAPEAARRAAPQTDDGVSFAGTSRKAAKISIANAPVEELTLDELLNQVEPTDSAMLHHQPPIAHTAASNRTAEERRNVAVTAWLHFAKKEDDNDYHVIIGTSPDPASGRRMNVEISGLPPHNSASFARLQSARAAFEAAYDASASHYTRYEPRQVRITGSLFYDIDHNGGTVGPQGFRGRTAWEIHPITKLEFAQ
jgi:hypothetical protein